MKSTYVKLLFLGIVFFLFAISILTYRNLSNYIKEVKLIRHSTEILETLEIVLSTIKDAESGHFGYQLTRDSTFLPPYYNSVEALPGILTTLDSLVKDNELQQRRVDTLQMLVNEHFIVISEILANTNRSERYTNRYENDLIQKGRLHMREIRQIGRRIRVTEEATFQERTSSESGLRSIAPISLLFYGLASLAGIAFLFSRVLDELEKRKNAENNLKENVEALRKEVAIREFTQKTLRNVLDNSLDGIMAFRAVRDPIREIVDFEWILANAVSFLSTRQVEKNLVGKRLLEIIPENRFDGLFEMYRQVVDSGKPNQIERHLTVNGLNNWFNITAVKLEDGFVVTFSDITDRKLYENQLKQYAAELKRSNEDLEQFAYVASHDLQEPLRKIRAFGDLAAKYQYKPEGLRTDYIKRMQSAAARMQVLIEDLLLFSRVSRSSNPFDSLLMKSVVEEVIDDLTEQVKREKATVQVQELPEIRGDRSQIKRLFQNLISNAIKFHKPNDPPVVVISGKRVRHNEVLDEFQVNVGPKEYARFSVKDNGIGFDEKYAEKIFNIFHRLHGRNEYEGTGIGLSICRKIVTNHQGYIVARGEENAGSEFIIILPVE